MKYYVRAPFFHPHYFFPSAVRVFPAAGTLSRPHFANFPVQIVPPFHKRLTSCKSLLFSCSERPIHLARCTSAFRLKNGFRFLTEKRCIRFHIRPYRSRFWMMFFLMLGCIECFKLIKYLMWISVWDLFLGDCAKLVEEN